MTRAGPKAQLLVATLVALLARGPAWAAVPLPQVVAAAAPQGPRVGVAIFCLDKKVRGEAGLWERSLEEALGKTERLEVVSSIDLYDSVGAKSRAAKRKDAGQRLKDGAKALDDLDNQKATEAFNAAVAELKDTDFSQTWSEFLDGLRFSAASHAMGGETAPAKQELERLLSLDATITLSSNFFSPDLLKFAEAQRRGIQSAKGELTVKTWPDGAPVWVDGKYRGLAPVTVKGLSAGKHFATVKLGGFALMQSELGLGDHTLELKPADESGSFLAAEKTVSRDPMGSERDAAARTLMKRTGLEQLVAVVLKKSLAGEKVEVTALRIDARDGHNWAYAQGTVAMGDQDAVAALAEKLSAKDESRKGGPVTHFVGGGASGTRVAGFALLGVGAALVGTGIFFGLQAQANADQYKATPQVQTVRSAGLIADGRTFAVVADVSYVVGGASLVTGAILALVGGSGGGGAEPAAEAKKKPDEGKAFKKTEPEKKSSSSFGSDFGKKSREDDKRRREEEERKKKDDDEKKKSDDERSQKDLADKKREDDARAEELKKKDEDERDAKKDKKKKSKKELADEKREEERERKRKEDEARAEEQKKKDEEREAKKKEDDARAEEQRKKAEEEHATKKDNKKKTKHERDEEERRKKEEALEQKKKDEERKKAEEEAQKREAEAKKKAEEDKKKKSEDHDDLRNF